MSDQIIDDAQRASLLRLARNTISRTVGHSGADEDGPDEGLPKMEAGAFVSLHKHGGLRGCIGNFDTSEALTKQVEEMAEAAATRDPRFSPVTAAEVDDLDIEISVLTAPRRIESPEEVVVGEHGLVISRGYRRGVLLPQVATEHNWDRETFLRHTCQKAGLPADDWQKPETVIEVFTAIVFGEKDR